MLEKRRYQNGNTTLHIVVVILTLSVFFCLWTIPDCPRAGYSSIPPGYLLLLPGNASSLPAPYPMSKLPPDDFTTLINLTNFKFLINNYVCNGTSPLVLILVHSHPDNIEKRQCIRRTWGSHLGNQIKLLFLVGLPGTSEVQQNIITENDKYSDMVQGNFKDAYRNMTYKHVMALKWTIYYCQQAKYLLKTDDDVFVNTPYLLEYINNNLSPHGARGLILCETFYYGVAERSFRSKWRVSFSEYKHKYYPTYCHGWAILYSPDVIYGIYSEAQVSEYFWIDDVHITGVIAAKKRYGRSSLSKFILTTNQVRDFIDYNMEPEVFLFGPCELTTSNIYALWKKVDEGRKKRSTVNGS